MTDRVILPDGSFIPRNSLGPCSCGVSVFDVRRRRIVPKADPSAAYTTLVVQCPACLKAHPTDELLGHLDARTGKMEGAR
jgi:hypothetical protein